MLHGLLVGDLACSLKRVMVDVDCRDEHGVGEEKHTNITEVLVDWSERERKTAVRMRNQEAEMDSKLG